MTQKTSLAGPILACLGVALSMTMLWMVWFWLPTQADGTCM